MIDERNETKRGMWWLGTATAVTRLIDVASSLVILALLTRQDMGTAALVLSAGAVIEAANGFGINYSVVRAKELTKNEEQSLFWCASGIGLLLGGVLVAIAPLVAAEYALPALFPMIAFTGIKHFLVGTALVPQQLLSRHLMFRQAGVVQAAATLGEALAKIVLAALGFGAWAIVIGNVFRAVVLLAIVLAVSDFRPRLHFVWSEASAHLRFGARLAVSAVLVHSYRNADYFLVGRVLGVEALGLYRVAFDLAMQPLEVVINVINRVTFPIYAKLAHDREALKNALLRSTRSMTLLAAPAVAFLFVASEDVLALVTHGRWGAAVPAISVLVWGALIRGAAHLFPLIYVVVGKPAYMLYESVATLVVLVSAFWCSLRFFPELGIVSVCWAWVLAYPGLIAMHLAFTRRVTPLRTFEYLRVFLPGVGGALFMLGSMSALEALGIGAAGPLVSVFSYAAVGCGVYAGYLRVVLKIGFGDLVPKKGAPRPA